MLQLFMFFAGVGLVVGGVAALQSSTESRLPRLSPKETGTMNVLIGVLGFGIVLAHAVAASIAVYGGGTPSLSLPYALAIFATTYLWLGINELTGANSAALGWYSVLVTCVAIPTGIVHLLSLTSASPFGVWLGLNWICWGILWFLLWLTLGLGLRFTRLLGSVQVVVGVATLSLPAALYFLGWLPA